MAPPGPPPYTLEQITAMTSPEERIRARAELKSYIVRMKKEKADRLAYQSNGHPSQAAGGEYPGSGFRNAFSNAGTGTLGPHTSHHTHLASGQKRGGYVYGGRGNYHPYQRPQLQYKNRSAVFSKSESATESSDATEAETSEPNATKKLFPARGGQQQTEPRGLCPALTSTGVCSRHGCRYLHDPNKQALCKRWLYKDDCPKGEFCPLSHEASPQNAPTCLHFQDGRCNNEDCRFAHIRINPAAPNCEAFGRIGYCQKGDTCTELHAHECPSFSNTGVCSYGDKCRLGHVHRASRMRKTTRHSSVDPSPSGAPGESMETSADMPGCTTDSIAVTNKPHQFTQQADFVPLDADL